MVASLVKQILATSRRIRDGRTRQDVFTKAGEEFGELAQEVLISLGKHYKEPGKDGVVGEAIDLIICCVDIIYGVQPNITEEELQAIAEKKLAKWLEKSELQFPGSTDAQT